MPSILLSRVDINRLWSDYTSNLVVECRKKGVACNRAFGGKKYTRREVSLPTCSYILAS